MAGGNHGHHRFRRFGRTEVQVNPFGPTADADQENPFVWLTGIALDQDGNVFASDEWRNRITIFDKDGEYLRHWGDHGSGDGQLRGPSGLAIRDDTLFIVDSRNHRVQKFTLDGKYLGQFGSFGDGPGQLNTPWGLGLDKDGNVFVADWRNDRIQSFTAEGEWLASFGRPGTGVDMGNSTVWWRTCTTGSRDRRLRNTSTLVTMFGSVPTTGASP